jgi:hypothetical protein
VARDRTVRDERGDAPPWKHATKRPYASIPMSQLATSRVRGLSGDAVRVLLWAHAAWTPNKSAAMPVEHTAKMLRLSRFAVSTAIRSLQPDLLTLKHPAVRPWEKENGTAPASEARKGVGRATIYIVAGRVSGTAHRVFAPGDRRYRGMFRIDSEALRQLAVMLTGNEARILVSLALPCDRTKRGAPELPAQIVLSSRMVSKALPNLPDRSAARAIEGLVAKGLLREVAPPSGRRAAAYEPAGLAASSRSKRNSSSMVHTRGQSDGAQSPENAGKTGAESGLSGGGDPVVRQNRGAKAPLCATKTTNGLATIPRLPAAVMDALAMFQDGPIPRDTGGTCHLSYTSATGLLARQLIAVARRPVPGTGGTATQRIYLLTEVGRAAMDRHRTDIAA